MSTTNKNNPQHKSHHTKHNKVNKKPCCFFCKYELKSKPKLINYKNTTIKVCQSCNKQKFKICSKDHQSKFLDCSICKKFVLYNTCIVCENCDHFVHRKCTKLTHEEIKNIENNNIPWNCVKCTEEIFHFLILVI